MLMGKLELQEEAFEHFQSRVQRLVNALYVELARQRMKASNAIYLKEFYRSLLQQRDAASRGADTNAEDGDGIGAEPTGLTGSSSNLRYQAFRAMTDVPENMLTITADEGRVVRSALADLNDTDEPGLDSMLVIGINNYLEDLNH